MSTSDSELEDDTECMDLVGPAEEKKATKAAAAAAKKKNTESQEWSTFISNIRKM